MLEDGEGRLGLRFAFYSCGASDGAMRREYGDVAADLCMGEHDGRPTSLIHEVTWSSRNDGLAWLALVTE